MTPFNTFVPTKRAALGTRVAKDRAAVAVRTLSPAELEAVSGGIIIVGGINRLQAFGADQLLSRPVQTSIAF